jgi:microsomal epoxide hydrolase
MRHRDDPQGPEEEDWAAKFDLNQAMQDGYRTQQATKPQTLGYAMMDSPFGVAAWAYFGRREEGGGLLSSEGKRVDVPTGCALFPKEMLAWPPRSYAERIYNITHRTEMPRGGHFGAMEEPELFVQDIRSFMRKLP